MSEFFDKFSGENYKGRDKTAAAPTPAANTGDKKGGITAVHHETVKDDAYARTKTIRIIVLAVAAVVLFAGSIGLYLAFSRVPVINFVGKSVTEARSWAASKGVTLDETAVYDKDKSTNIVLSQTIPAGDTLAGGGVLGLTISKGPDPGEKIAVPDFTDMTPGEIQSWINDNKLSNTNMTTDNSDTVPADKVVSAEFQDAGVNKDNFTRGDYLVIIISKGSSMAGKGNVSNYVGATKAEADKKAGEDGITISYKKAVSETVPEGIVISQSITAFTVVDRGSIIQLVISAGKGVEVPNYASYTAATAATASDKVKVTVVTRYSDSVPYGKLISQSVAARSKLLPDENYVTAVYSIGRPYIENLTGKLEKDLAPYFFGFTSQGANISYSVSYVHSASPKGTVVGSSRYGEFLSMTDSVVVYVSDGVSP